VLFTPLLHQALIVLDDGEPELLLAVAGMVIVGEEAQGRCEELRLLERLNVWEVHVALRAAEAPRRHVVHARRQFWCVVGAEGELIAAGANLGVKRVVGARLDASKTERSAATWRYLGEKGKRWRWRWCVENKKWSRWRMEKKKLEVFMVDGEHTLRQSAPKVWRFVYRNSARATNFFARTILTPPLEEHGKISTQ
jgi:hypothetical protein